MSQTVSGLTTLASKAEAITRTLNIDPGSNVSEITGFLKYESPYS